MKTVKRFDFQSLPVRTLVKTDAGFLRVPIRATRVGVFEYVQPDGSIRRELRPEEEVFNKDSLATLAGVPLTIAHPKDLVNVKNVKNLSVGFTGDAIEKAEERFVDLVGTVTDSRAVAMLERKRDQGLGQEVSCGYVAEMDFTPGIWNGQHYDAVQRNIRYNHVAFVDRGRAGPEARVKLDESDNAYYHENNRQGDESMEKITINGKEFEVSPELATAVKADAMNKEDMGKKIKEKEDELKKMKEDFAHMKKEKDGMEGKKDALETEIASLKEKSQENKMDAAQIDALVQERADVCAVAEKVIGAEFKKDGKENLAIKKEVIATISPDLKLDEKSDDYVNARFDAIAEQEELFVDHLKNALENKNDEEGKEKETKVDAEDARQKMMAASRDAWKQGLEN
jgi:hypothetical protein